MVNYYMLNLKVKLKLNLEAKPKLNLEVKLTSYLC
jgi:hypothetical protein